MPALPLAVWATDAHSYGTGSYSAPGGRQSTCARTSGTGHVSAEALFLYSCTYLTLSRTLLSSPCWRQFRASRPAERAPLSVPRWCVLNASSTAAFCLLAGVTWLDNAVTHQSGLGGRRQRRPAAVPATLPQIIAWVTDEATTEGANHGVTFTFTFTAATVGILHPCGSDCKSIRSRM